MYSRLVSSSPVVVSGLFTVSSFVPACTPIRGLIISASRPAPTAAAPAATAPRRKRLRFKYLSFEVIADEGMSAGLRINMNDLALREKSTQPLDTLEALQVTAVTWGR